MAQATQEYDPFEAFTAFNDAMGAGMDDPHSMLAGLREVTPVFEADFRSMMGMMSGNIGDDGGTGAFLQQIEHSFVVLSYDLVQEVLRDGQTFSSQIYEHLMGPLMGHSILEMDDPEHRRYRSLVQQAFTRKALDRWQAEMVAPVCHELVDGFAKQGEVDLVREYTFYFPINVIARLLGLPAADLDRFHRLAVELISGSFNLEIGSRASGELLEYFGGILEARRRSPSDDLISMLAEAELEGQRLSDEEIFSFLRLLLPAGAETTFRSAGNLLLGLLKNPDQLDAVRTDRALLPQAIEEGIRWEPPLTAIMRYATRETSLADVVIPAGSVVIAHMGAANRDPSRWTNPDQFDIQRQGRPHASFAFGPHTCLGMHLARMETTVAINVLLDRLEDIRLTESGEKGACVTGLGFRSPTSLPISFTPEV